MGRSGGSKTPLEQTMASTQSWAVTMFCVEGKKQGSIQCVVPSYTKSLFRSVPFPVQEVLETTPLAWGFQDVQHSVHRTLTTKHGPKSTTLKYVSGFIYYNIVKEQMYWGLNFQLGSQSQMSLVESQTCLVWYVGGSYLALLVLCK